MIASLGPGFAVMADQAPPSPDPEYVEVTATRIPEDVETVPASMTIISGDDMRRRGARDLYSALALAAGIDIGPGGDGGPAASVPEFWGLREFDAFLLVVDGVPWGGAFNPALATLDLSDVERIEVLRGAAPVIYGATSFVGVIQIVRRAPGAKEGRLGISAGSYGSGSLAGRTALPAWGSLVSSVSAQLERAGFRDDRTRFERGHVLWRGSVPAGGGHVRLDLEGTWLRQDPSSPHPRDGVELSFDVPLDANHNPTRSRLNERRIFVAAGYEHAIRSASWSTTLAVTRSSQGILRGFLVDLSSTSPNAHGIRENISTNDLYFDSHLESASLARTRVVFGIDHLYGRGRGNGGDFEYFVDLEGDTPPDGNSLANAADVKIQDTRNFTGAYGQVEWSPADRLRFDVGARVNRTSERRRAFTIEFGMGATEGGTDSRTVVRGGGAAGATWTAWQRKDDAVRLYASFRNTFKPAATDFGLDSKVEILSPETAKSYESGLKGRLAGGRFEFEVSTFQMNFNNLVLNTTVNNGPALENAGRSRFRGIEADVEWRILETLHWRTAYSLHDARFRNFVTDLGSGPVQLRGNRQEMSPRYLVATGLIYAPAGGWAATTQVSFVGSRFLNKRNTANSRQYVTWSAGVGYRLKSWEVRLDGTNLNNQRPPVSESELGDAQYYRLPARRILLSGNHTF